jgi:cysteine-rich repeat protein
MKILENKFGIWLLSLTCVFFVVVGISLAVPSIAKAVCGDGIVDIGEECDDGNTVDGDGCSSTCVLEECGNGIIEGVEECDDGNTNNDDSCRSDCTIPVCGDGILDDYPPFNEECDDGNTIPGDGCENDCTITTAICGDGTVDAGEECDDGNTVSLDGCSADCADLEDGTEGTACVRDAIDKWTGNMCTANDVRLSYVDITNGIQGTCADGEDITVKFLATIESAVDRYDIGVWINQNADSALDSTGEDCFRTLLTPLGADCTGENFWDADVEDICGDLPSLNNTGVTACGTIPYYPTTIPAPPTKYIAACSEGGGSCLYSFLEFTVTVQCTDTNGNGFADVNACTSWDNTQSGSACSGDLSTNPNTSSKCWCGTVELPIEFASCGDGITQETLEEECDDGNTIDGDGCNSECQLEYCGDGILQVGLYEECDDGNTVDGDGTCQGDCNLPLCGDGIPDPGEECDDDNTVDGDGCNATCQYEYCGDGIIQASLGEVCDDGESNNSTTCGCQADCAYAPAATSCADGLYCNGDETCDGTGLCQPGTPLVCNDGNECTADSCDPAIGCVYTDTSASCDDSNECTADSCDPFIGCVNEDISFTCNDGNVCTTDSCDPVVGCLYTNNNDPCGDQTANACTDPDTCEDGICQPNNIPCSFVTSSSLCPFDVEPRACANDIPKFRVAFTPDVKNWPAYKQNATNPGQFYYNLIYDGKVGDTLRIFIPWPFVTQGARPVHVYDANSTVIEDGCFLPCFNSTSACGALSSVGTQISLADWVNGGTNATGVTY